LRFSIKHNVYLRLFKALWSTAFSENVRLVYNLDWKCWSVTYPLFCMPYMMTPYFNVFVATSKNRKRIRIIIIRLSIYISIYTHSCLHIEWVKKLSVHHDKHLYSTSVFDNITNCKKNYFSCKSQVLIKFRSIFEENQILKTVFF